MKPNPNRLWYVVLALGWLFDFLFWQKVPGVNFAIFAALCLLGAFFVLLSEGKSPDRRTLWLVPLIAFFAIVTFVRREPLTLFLGFAFTLFLMSLLAVTYAGGGWILYTVLDYFDRFVRLLGSLIGRASIFATETRKHEAASGEKPRGNLWPVVRGIVIALPVLVLFASLLASADAIFSQRLDEFVQLFNLEKLPEYIFRLVYILIGAYALAGVFLHAYSQSGDEKTAASDGNASTGLLGFTESSIVLGSLLVLFAVFVGIQFRYFFGGGANITIDGFTYSEYARRGFGELVAVAFFTLLLLFGLSAVTRRTSEAHRRTFSILGAGLVALVLVMLVSAYQRLALYEAAYGFSRLRTYTHVVLVWIGLLLVATIVLEMMRRERLFASAALLAALGFGISLAALNVDGFIVRHNVRREIEGAPQATTQIGGGRQAPLDAGYFIELSDDAIPTLVREYRSASTPDSVKESLGAALACIRYRRAGDADELTSWQSFHLSRFYADRALDSIRSDLDAYALNDSDWPVLAITPSGEQFSCSSYTFD